MQIDNRFYPHPVLSPFTDDLIDCTFQSTVKITTTRNTYVIDAIFKTSCSTLIEMVRAKHAQYALHVECSETRYRGIFVSDKNELRFEILSDSLDGRVQVCSFIIAAENISSYSNPNFHSDYGGRTFAISKGDILAIDSERFFDAEKEIDPLRKIPSIFSIQPNHGPDAPPIEVDPSSQRVVVKLSEENFELYKRLVQDHNYHSTLSGLVVVPALISCLDLVFSTSSTIDFEDKRWYRTVVRKLKEIGYDPTKSDGFTESKLEIAQKLLGSPLSDALKTLQGYEENTED